MNTAIVLQVLAILLLSTGHRALIQHGKRAEVSMHRLKMLIHILDRLTERFRKLGSTQLQAATRTSNRTPRPRELFEVKKKIDRVVRTQKENMMKWT